MSFSITQACRQAAGELDVARSAAQDAARAGDPIHDIAQRLRLIDSALAHAREPLTDIDAATRRLA